MLKLNSLSITYNLIYSNIMMIGILLVYMIRLLKVADNPFSTTSHILTFSKNVLLNNFGFFSIRYANVVGLRCWISLMAVLNNGSVDALLDFQNVFSYCTLMNLFLKLS